MNMQCYRYGTMDLFLFSQINDCSSIKPGNQVKKSWKKSLHYGHSELNASDKEGIICSVTLFYRSAVSLLAVE